MFAFMTPFPFHINTITALSKHLYQFDEEELEAILDLVCNISPPEGGSKQYGNFDLKEPYYPEVEG